MWSAFQRFWSEGTSQKIVVVVVLGFLVLLICSALVGVIISIFK